MQNVSPFAVLTIAPFVIAVVVLILAALGQFGAKKQARWLRKNTPIPAIIEQCVQGLLPIVIDGGFVYHLRYAGSDKYELINPTSNRSLKIGDGDQTMALLKRWGYCESWRVGAPSTAGGYHRPKQGKVTEVTTAEGITRVDRKVY